MKIGDLIRDKMLDKLGIIIEFGFDEDVDEAYAVVQLADNSHVLCSYEDMELIACNL